MGLKQTSRNGSCSSTYEGSPAKLDTGKLKTTVLENRRLGQWNHSEGLELAEDVSPGAELRELKDAVAET